MRFSLNALTNLPRRTLVRLAVLAVLFLLVLPMGFKWAVEREYVGPDEALMVISKFGNPLPPDQIVIHPDQKGYKGVQEELLGPGRYFFNPIEYSTQVVKLTSIPAGEPQKWDWDENGNLKDPRTAPMTGLVSIKEGKTPPPGMEVVGPGYKGIQREVLTPGTYKLNPQKYEVELKPAVVVPPGFVGVVTRQTGDVGQVPMASLSQSRAATTAQATTGEATTGPAEEAGRLVAGPTQRGILKDVLQPGIYYLNPRLVNVSIVSIGYDAITLDHQEGTGIKFYSSDGYQVEADFTVVWGRGPADAPHIVANIGGIDKVKSNVIEPAMKAACQNEGARYSAKELIQGTTRSAFQDALSTSLENQVRGRNVHVLLALIRNIAIKDSSTDRDVTGGLLATIQQANIEKERDLTNKQKAETAGVKAELEQEMKLVDVARETVAAETSVKVANLAAEGNKKAAEIDAGREVEVASIALEMSKLDAERTQILGQAAAEVERLKNDAEAQGSKMLVDALGTPQSYNLYTFAKNFEPQDLRLIFAGPGTFWTDLKSFQDVGASKVLQAATDKEAVKK